METLTPQEVHEEDEEEELNLPSKRKEREGNLKTQKPKKEEPPLWCLLIPFIVQGVRVVTKGEVKYSSILKEE